MFLLANISVKVLFKKKNYWLLGQFCVRVSWHFVVKNPRRPCPNINITAIYPEIPTILHCPIGDALSLLESHTSFKLALSPNF